MADKKIPENNTQKNNLQIEYASSVSVKPVNPVHIKPVFAFLCLLLILASLFISGCKEETILRSCQSNMSVSCLNKDKSASGEPLRCKTDSDCTRKTLESSCSNGFSRYSCLDESLFCENEICKAGCRCKIKKVSE